MGTIYGRLALAMMGLFPLLSGRIVMGGDCALIVDVALKLEVDTVIFCFLLLEF